MFLAEENINIGPKLDEKTFEMLFKQHFKSMLFFAQRYLKDLDSAKEVTHDAFVNLWEKRDSIDHSKPITAYLGTIIHNRCLNHLRDNKKFDKSILVFEKLSNEPDSTSDWMISQETQKLIHAAVDELPEKCREIFVLNRFEQMKYQEIANHLGISVKTVEAQMSKALLHMKTRLSSYIKVLLLIIFYHLN